MTLAAVLLSLFLFHLNKSGMVLVSGDMGRGFRRRIPEKEKDGSADSNKNKIIYKEYKGILFCLFLFVHLQVWV
jgi:hypothetical protein